MFCLLCVFSGAYLLSIANIKQKTSVIYDKAFPAAESSWRLQIAAHQLMDIIESAAVASRADILSDIPAAEVRLNNILADIKLLETNNYIEAGIHDAVLTRYKKTKSIGLAWVDATLNEKWEQEPILGAQFNQANNELQDLIDGIRRDGSTVLTNSISTILANTKRVYVQTFFIGIAGLMLFVFLSIVTSRSIINPLSELLVFIQNLRKQEDDYSQRVATRSSDEIGRLAQEFNRMLEEKEGYQRERRNYTERLESQVKDRTLQLNEEKEAHKESEEYLQTIFNSTRAGILVIDAEHHTIVDANPFALGLLNKTLPEIKGMDCHHYICPSEEGKCPITDLGMTIDGTERLLPVGDNEQIDIFKTVVPFTRKGKQLLLESFIDISALKEAQNSLNAALNQMEKQVENRTLELAETNQLLRLEIEERKHAEIENRRLQEQLKTSEKMEAIGKLAGSVAHDLNNVLSGIVSYPDLLLMQLPEDSNIRDKIQMIKRSGEKAAAIVQDLLTLARRNVISKELIQLNDLITLYIRSPEHEKMMSYHDTSDVVLDLSDSLLPIKGSHIHLQKTLMNLISNGLESMLTGGRLSISTHNIHLDRPLKGYSDVSVGDYVVLEITDEGIGISQEDRGKIFEPFFTKKAMGRSGTGLGMSVVWNTVIDHDGYIDLGSEEGCGTSFRLYFPVADERLENEILTITIDKYTGDGENILIIDDSKDQRNIASAILEKLNYRVHAVDSGEAAVDYLKANSADLVILDMIMDPGIDGFTTYKQILEISPGQKAIIASGFTETYSVRKTLMLGAGEYIRKPYTMEKIGLAVRRELDRIEKE